MVAWERLIWFVATDGRVLRGEPIIRHPDFDLGYTTDETKLKVKIIIGADLYDITGATRVTDEVVTVKHLLSPLSREDVPILRCVGICQDAQADYEGELVGGYGSHGAQPLN
jgi:hypothetical protein